MAHLPLPVSDHQRAGATAHWGHGHRAGIAVDVTSRGLLAIGALVTSILLSTAVIVHVAGRAAATDRQRP